ncbi:hypothetical protein [Devosia sp.]|uniref:hypothetical protein n=1 Tax=Devosia sp. TaxID=1871048 RepID=UPI002FC7AECA
MKKIIIATTLAALLSTSALPVLAQDAGVGVDAGAGVTVDTPAVDAAAGADASAKANAGMSDNTFGSVMSSISGSADVDLSAVTDEANVTIVLLSSLQGNAATEAAALDAALSANADAMTTLHANVEGNAAIKAKLEAEGYVASDVVAVKGNADSSVIVYVDDRA